MNTMEKICRLCMTSTEDLISIFQTIDEFDRSIANKISACVAIEAVEGDGLPSEICKECATLLDVMYNFKEKCRASDWTLRKLKARVTYHHHQFVGPVYKLMNETNPDVNLDERLAKNLIGYHNAAPAEGPETFLVQKGPEVIAITVVDPNAPGDIVKCHKMDKFAQLKEKLKDDREKATALKEHKKQVERMRKGDGEILNISKGQPIRVKKTVQNSSSLTPDSTRNTANSKENASVSEHIKNRIRITDPLTRNEKLAPVLELEPLPSTSDTYSSEAIVCQNPVTVVKSQSTNRKRRKSSNRQKELNRLRIKEYRRNMTEEKKEQQRRKDRERYQKKKKMNITKSISEMTAEEKRLKRREWRINSRRYYQNKKLKLQSEKVNDDVNKLSQKLKEELNYICKLESEVQSMHFGASKK